MTELFIDSDVIIDFLIDRKPFSQDAAKIFSLIAQKKVKGYSSSLCFSNIYYVLSKYASHKIITSKLKELSELIRILKVDEKIILSALHSNFKDFEDAIQYFTAAEHKRIDIIVTRNIKDFKKSVLPVLTPETFLKTYEQTAGS